MQKCIIGQSEILNLPKCDPVITLTTWTKILTVKAIFGIKQKYKYVQNPIAKGGEGKSTHPTRQSTSLLLSPTTYPVQFSD